MLNLKKTAVAVLALGSSTVFAGTMGPVCTPGSVTVPCERMAWDIGAQALYLTPSQKDYSVNLGVPAGAPVTTWAGFDDDWSWGFQIEGSYHFGTGNDVNVNWSHLDNDNNNHYFAAGSTFIGTTFSPDVPFNAATDLHWDAVNFEFAQTVNFGEHKVIRFHGGAQYANLERIFNVATASGATYFGNGKEEFSGFGPRTGLDMAYHMGNGLAIYGKAAAALVIGDTKFSGATAGFGPLGSSKRDTIVPELEAKLGATYSYAMAQGDLTIDAGWMAVNYFNVLQVPGSQAADVGLNGPYIGAKWVGNVA